MTGGFLSSVMYREGVNKRTLPTLLIAAGLSFSPDVVKMWNTNRGLFSLKIKNANEKVVLSVDGIACESCASKVKAAILSTLMT
jgi:hypothetical protein